MRMVALREFNYAHRALKVGDEFDTEHDKHALVLTLKRVARKATVSPSEPPAPASSAPDGTPKSLRPGRYARRDMRAKE